MHTPESPAHATGVKVSRVVFGGNVLGWTADQATGFAMLDRLVDAGLTTIDTADVYSGWVPGHQGGESESVIGAWLRARGPAQRERVQIMTKVGKRAAANPPPGEGLSPAYLAQAIAHRWRAWAPTTSTCTSRTRSTPPYRRPIPWAPTSG